MTRGKKVLAPALFSEGYCCRWGYLSLCAARGERQVDMAKFLNIPSGRIRDAYYLMRKGKYKCLANGECMKGVIEELRTPEQSPPKRPFEPGE